MLLRLVFTLFILCSLSCKTIHAGKTAHPVPAPAATPMSCSIHGEIVTILKTPVADTGSICYKHPCRAMVRIVEVFECGSSVSLPLVTGDTVEMNFAYTLANTAKIFPSMKVQYPGLKKGAGFTANAEQRLRVGAGGEFVIYGYELK